MCLVIIPIQEGDDLTAGAGFVWPEGGFGGAGGDAVFHRPQYGLVIKIFFLYVGKGIVAGFGLGATRRPPQKGGDLTTGAGGFRRKGGFGGAGGDIVLHRPQHGLVIIVALLYVGKGIFA